MKVIKVVLLMVLSSNIFAANPILHVGMSSIPETINHMEIHSVNEYVIFDDLLRPLVKFDSNGEIAADLVLKWEISDQYKRYVFTLKNDQHFSDGSLITINDVVTSLQYLSNGPDIVHGDSKKIKQITALDQYKFEIILFESDPFFLTELSSPEYRIVKSGNSNYLITSGPYSADRNHKKNELILKLNSQYPFPKEVKYKEVHFIQYDPKHDISDDLLKTLDLIWPKSTITYNEIEKIKKHGFDIYKMNLGFSYWFNFNPQRLNNDERQYLKNKLDLFWKKNSFFSKNNLSRSFQLFLPYGPGRLTESEVKTTQKDATHFLTIKRTLKALLPKTVQAEINNSLRSLGVKVEIEYYDNFSEYSKMIEANNYDILFVNNDLSSVDLRSSLLVTFNPSRPLVFIEKENEQYKKLLKSIQTEQNSSTRYQNIHKLGQQILEDVLVYPLYYDMGFVFAKKNIDLNNWDKAGAETFAWKIK